MGPKQKGGGGGGASKQKGNTTEEVEETLQAVVRVQFWGWEKVEK
jgi:translation initiation factor eIF-2B subunit epsilon